MMQQISQNPDRKHPVLSGIKTFLIRHDQLVLITVILGLALFYNYPETLLKRPQSVHSWRQCDGASLALNYDQNGMKFFKPATHGLYSDGETTGYTSPSEIPILYYFVAFLYKIFGYHEFIFRGTNLLLFFLGLFYLYKLAWGVLQDKFYATAVVVLLFASPVIVYYANNFLPNPVALSFTLIGWYYFYTYSVAPRTWRFLVSVAFFGIAAMMKITELSGPIILLVLMMADKLNITKLRLNSGKHFIVKTGALISIFILVASWIMYAKYYNNLHESSQFSTFTFPFWNLDAARIRLIFHKMHVIWFRDYYWPPTLYFLLTCLISIPFLLKRTNKILTLAVLLYFIGLIGFSLLWFEALGDHDYFFTGFYILPAFLFILAFQVTGSLNLKTPYSFLVKIAVLAFVVANVVHARERHKFRYNSWMNDYADFQDLYKINPSLQQAGIHENDTVVYFASLNIRPLYLMNLKGWTLRDYREITPIIDKSDSLLMVKYIRAGAKYFIANDINALARRKSLLPYTRTLYAKYRSVFVFSIPSQEKNFELTDSMKSILNLSCDVESNDKSGLNTWFSDSVHHAITGGLLSTQVARSGGYSVMVNGENPYGLTTTVKAAAFDMVTVSAYQYPQDNHCFLVVSSKGSYQFNVTQQEVIAVEKSGWIRVMCKAVIPAYFDKDSISVYFWNAGDKNVYIDDLEIRIERRYNMMSEIKTP